MNNICGNNTLNKQNIYKAVILQFLSLLLLIFIILFFTNFKNNESNIFHFGLSSENNPIKIFGIEINNWNKYFILMLYLIINEAIATWSFKIYKNWYRNCLLDPKSKTIGMSDKEALFLVNIWSIVTFIPSIFKYMIVIVTKQMQFLVPGYLTRIIVSTYIDKKYLLDKNII